jgi:hypothetical protein
MSMPVGMPSLLWLVNCMASPVIQISLSEPAGQVVELCIVRVIEINTGGAFVAVLLAGEEACRTPKGGMKISF